MNSQRQTDANRRNAQKSTGPRTPEGRSAVRFNALRHGLTAKNAVLSSENTEDFQNLLEAFHAEHQPASPTENLLVEQLVMAAWRLERLRRIETGLFNLRMIDHAKELEHKYTGLDDTHRLAFVFLDDTRGAGAIRNLFRYETRIEQAFYGALHSLQQLRMSPAPPAPGSDGTDDKPDPSSAQGTPSPAEPDFAKQSHSQDRTP